MFVQKTLLVAVAFIIGLVIGVPVFAATNPLDPSTIGLVDINRIFDTHPITSQLAELERELVTELEKRQQDLNARGRGKTREEVQALEAEMNLEWEPIRDEMIRKRQDFIDQRYLSVIEAIRKIAEEMNLVLVIRREMRIPVGEREMLEMPVVLYGGVDITEQVVAALRPS
ncbi:MAG TPA: OmpH family outer membrane protein [Atribacteraceae bacterium]|nr:OmpH family outer membrane protein [Atribacteraceae bacterium]